MRILVLRGGALGDFLVTLPALGLLREHWPDAQIELVGNATAAALALRAGQLNVVHSQHESRWTALYDSSPLPAALATWLGAFDLILCYWPDPDGELARRFPSRNGQGVLFAGALPTLAPAAAHYCAPLHQLGLTPRALLYPLRHPKPQGFQIALHPGSGSPRKNWPLDRWEALAYWLIQDLGASVSVISGPAEPANLFRTTGEILHCLPLDELADQLAACRLFIGHDSGVSHLAASTGVPCILLFGPTDPAMWAPPSPSVRVLRAGDELSAISLAAVQQAVRATLPDQN